MFPELITANKRRSVMLLACGFVLLLLVGTVVGYLTGLGNAAVPLAVGIALVSTWGAYYASDTLALSVTGATRVDATSQPQLMNVVEEMALASGLPMPKVAIVDDPAPNAFATGRNPEHATIAVTSGLLRVMNRDQLQGVVAHEMSHVANRDTLVATVAVTIVGAVTLLCDMVWRFAGFGGGRRRSNDPASGIIAIVGLVLLLLAPLLAALMQAAVSRKREALADASGVAFTRNPAGLRSALEVLQADTTVVAHPSRATAHLWIESPLDRDGSSLNRLFDTHPPLSERIATLRAMESGGVSSGGGPART